MKIELDDTLSGRSLSKIQANFQKIEDALNDSVLWRDNVEGEPNQMEDLLDMNGQQIINLPVPSSPNSAARLQDIQNAVTGIVPAALIPFSPTGTIGSTNVQTAVAEVASEATSGIALIRTDLADTNSVGLGDALLGVKQPYTGAVARTQHSKNTELVSAMDFGAVGNGVADDSAAILALITYCTGAKRTAYLPNGTYLTNALVLSDRRISLVGESTLGTIIQMKPGFTGIGISMLNTNTNGGDTFERLENFTILGTYGVGSIGISQRLTSRASIRNVIAKNFDTNLRQIDNYCFYAEQFEAKDGRTNIHLVGSNHNSEYVRCGSVAFGDSWGGLGTALKVEALGLDLLQSSLAFRGCDFEFGTGDAIVSTVSDTITFDNCYMEGVGGTMFRNNGGHIDVDGGVYIIKDSTGFLVDPFAAGSTLTFDGAASIGADGTSRTYASIIKGGGSGTVDFRRSRIWDKLITTASGVLPPLLGRGVVSAPYLRPAGRNFISTNYTGTATTLTTGDIRRFTCTVAGSIGVSQVFVTPPRVGANCVLVVSYRANSTFQATTVTGLGQAGTVTTLGNVPNSSSTLLHVVFPMARIVDNTQTAIEFWKPSWAVNDFLEIVEAWWIDGGAISNGQLSLG